MCPICKQKNPPKASNKHFPFCSERCQLIDLGRWLDGEYRIAGESHTSNAGDDREPWS